jgi:hypothetical protein
MRATGAKVVQYILAAAVLILVHGVDAARAQSGTQSSGPGEIRIVEAQGRVEIMPAGATTWVLTQTN